MSAPVLRRGDSVPHFEVKTLQGGLISYSTIWQRRNLVVVALPASGSGFEERYVAQLTAKLPEFRAAKAECVITRDPVPGIHIAGVIVADQWGEIAHVASASRADDLPSVEELLEWLEYLERRCPECEGESQ